MIDELRLIGMRIKRERHKRDWTLIDLADRTGISKSHISLIERGHCDLSLGNFIRLSKAFDIPPESLLNNKDTINDKLNDNIVYAFSGFNLDETQAILDILNVIKMRLGKRRSL